MQRRSLALATASGGAFLGFLDTTIVNVAFPDVSASFAGAGRARAVAGCWTATSSSSPRCSCPPAALADRYGRKRLVPRRASPASCSPARCARWRRRWQALVAARVLQAVAAAVLTPASLALVLAAFPQRERAAAVAAWSAWARARRRLRPAAGRRARRAGGLALDLPRQPPARRARDRPRPAGPRREPRRAGGRGARPARARRSPRWRSGCSRSASSRASWGWTSAPVLGVRGAALLGAVLARRCVRHARPVVDPALLRIPSFRRGSLGALRVLGGAVRGAARQRPLPHRRVGLQRPRGRPGGGAGSARRDDRGPARRAASPTASGTAP